MEENNRKISLALYIRLEFSARSIHGTIHHGLCLLLPAYGTLFARATANCNFPGKLKFQKRFPDAVQEFKNLFFGSIGHWPKITNIYKYNIHTESDMVINSYL